MRQKQVATTVKSRLYHMVPERMAGNTLYPLNVLSQIYPSAAAEENQKYIGREHLMRVKLPIFNCFWNDVIHFSPVHPRLIKGALIQAGAAPDDLPMREFFIVDPGRLREGQALYFHNSIDTKGRYIFREDDFSLFSHEKYKELEAIPAAQHEYNKRAIGAGEKPLLWARTPHVLYAGSINIEGMEKIEW